MRPITFLAALVAALVLQAAFAANAGADVGWAWPVRGDVVTKYRNGDDPYAGGQHRGIDIAARVGTPVVAATGGRVTFAGSAGASGVTVSMRSADGGYDLSYLHLSSVAVREGAEVGRGERVGAVGTTGTRSVAQPHLHFGVRVAGSRSSYIDPLDLLPPLTPPATEPQTPSPSPVPAPVPVRPATTGLIPVLPTAAVSAPGSPPAGIPRSGTAPGSATAPGSTPAGAPGSATAPGSTSAPAHAPALSLPGGASALAPGGDGAALGAEAAVVAAPPVTPAAAVTEPAAATAAGDSAAESANAASPAAPGRGSRSAHGLGFERGAGAAGDVRAESSPRGTDSVAAVRSRDGAAGGSNGRRSAGTGDDASGSTREPVTPPAHPLSDDARTDAGGDAAAGGGSTAPTADGSASRADNVVRLPTTRPTPPDDGFDPGWLAALVGCLLAACCLGRPEASARAARGGSSRLAAWLRPLTGR